MEKRVVIVGAGIAGLSAGIYARRNGYEAIILEKHAVPGGLCAAWTRKGYTFDISMHMLVGSKSGVFHRMWEELGVMDGQEFHYHDAVLYVEDGEKRLDITTDPARLEEQMVALSPEDAEISREFVRLCSGRSLMGAAALEPDKMVPLGKRLKTGAAILPLLGVFRKYGSQTIQEFAARFRDPFLREAVRFFIDSPAWPMPGFPMVAMAGMFHSAVTGAGTPLGGSNQVMVRMADLFKELGGEIRYRTSVEDLIVENDTVRGVRLAGGEEIRADEVVWAADGHKLIFDILGGRYIDEAIREMYDQWVPTQSLVHVMIGVDRDLSGEPHRSIFTPEKPLTIAGEEHRWMSVLHRCYDPSFAPPGKSVVEVWYATDYDYWEDLAKDRSRYEGEKKRIADATLAALDRRWEGFTDEVEVVDVSTPATYVRYTGNWRGSPDGWYITPDNMRNQEPVRNLPGLSGLHMAGQWTAPFTGTVMAALTGRQLIQLLCRRDGEKFIPDKNLGT